MSAYILDKLVCIVDIYWNNDLFVRGSLGGHIEFLFWLFTSTDDFLYYFDFFVLQLWKCFFEFKNIPDNIRWVRVVCWCLSIRFFLIRQSIFFEILRDFVDFLGQFCQNKRRKRGYIRRVTSVFTFWGWWFLISLRTKFWFDVGLKRFFSTINH